MGEAESTEAESKLARARLACSNRLGPWGFLGGQRGARCERQSAAQGRIGVPFKAADLRAQRAVQGRLQRAQPRAS